MADSHSKIQLVVFDLDGTLVDSRLDITLCVNRALANHGLAELSELIVAGHVGTGIRPLLKQEAEKAWRKGPGELSPRYDALVQTFEELYFKHLADSTRLYAGMADVLAQIKPLPIVVLTNKRQIFADLLLERIGLTSTFAAIHGREAFARPNPDPMPLVEICRTFKCPPSKAMMVGDTDVDIICGKSAGTKTCAALYGYGDRQRLLASPADCSIRAPGELLEHLGFPS